MQPSSLLGVGPTDANYFELELSNCEDCVMLHTPSPTAHIIELHIIKWSLRKSFLWLIDELLHYTRRIHHLDGMNVIWNKNFDEYKLWLSIFHKYPDYNPIESGQKLPVKLSLTVRIISFFLRNIFRTKFIRILKRYWNVPVLKQSLTNYTKYNIKFIFSLPPFIRYNHYSILFKMKNEIVVWCLLFVLFLFNILITNIDFEERI